MRLRPKILATTIATAAAVFLLGAHTSSALAFGVSSNPCALISESALGKDLGLAHVKAEPLVGPSYPTEQDGQVASKCTAAVWSGGKPKSYRQVLKGVAEGTDAGLYIRTWITDPGAPLEENGVEIREQWENTEFPKTIEGLEIAGLGVFVGGIQGTGFTPPILGAEFAKEYQGVVKKRIGVAAAFWWNSSSHSIILLGLEVSKHKDASKQLEKIASGISA